MRITTTLLTLLLTTTPLLAAEPAHGEAAAANPFAGTIYQSVAAAIVFLLLLGLLKKLAWGPILKGLQDREAKIKQDLEAAESAAKVAQETLNEYRRQVATAHEEAKKIIEKGRADAEKVAHNLQAQTESEITEMKKRAEADIRFAKEQALREIYTHTARLATSVAGKILSREITDGDNRRLIDESLGEIEKKGMN